MLEERAQHARGLSSYAPKLTVEEAADRLDPAGIRGRPARSAAVRRPPAPGRPSTAQRLKLGPATPRAGPRRARPRRPGGGQAGVSWSAPAPTRSSSARCSRPASRGCAPPTGLAACATAPARLGTVTADDHAAPEPGRSVDPARQTAYDALRLVDTDDAYLNLALPRLLGERGAHRPRRGVRHRARARHRAAAGQLRRDPGRARARAAPRRSQPAVLTALRLGTHQLLSMRVPSHAAVGTTVELVRAAVGRAPGADGQRGAAPRGQPAARRVAGPRSPRRVRRPGRAPRRAALAPALDRRRVPEPARRGRGRGSCSAADNVPPLVTLAGPPRAGTVDRAVTAITPGRWSPYAGVLAGRRPGCDLRTCGPGVPGCRTKAPSWRPWRWPRPTSTGRDERWLDLCAGPGGKAALLTGLARERGAVLVAPERLPHRAALVRCCVAWLTGRPRPWSAATGSGRRGGRRRSTG